MRTFALTHLSDAALDRDLEATVGRERTDTAWVLAHIAESDARRRYAALGYPSMFAYCMGRLQYSEDAASKRIQAARRFPVLFGAVAEGRLHLTGLNLLAPHFTPPNLDELLAAATYASKSEIERLIARRFPRTEVMALVQPLRASPTEGNQPALAHVDTEVAGVTRAAQHAPAHVEKVAPPPRVRPLAAERYAIQFTIGQETHDLLQQAQALLSHAVPSGDLATVFHRALEALVPQLERRKFAATAKPGPRSQRSSSNPPTRRVEWSSPASSFRMPHSRSGYGPPSGFWAPSLVPVDDRIRARASLPP